MKFRALLISALLISAITSAANPDDAPRPAPKPAPVLTITEQTIHQAVKDTIAEMPSQAAPLRSGAAISTATESTEQRMSRAFAEARIPDCLHSEAMKFTPPHIGPIGVVGMYALPWLGYAALSGKCR